MKKLITLLVLGLVLTSCGSQYQLSTLNHEPEYIGDVRVDIIDNEMELSRKLRFDDKFRWDFAQYAMRQDMRWNYDFYWNNRMYRRGVGSPSDFYWNSQLYWWNWASNSPFNMGFNHWDPFGFNNNYGMGWSYSWNNRSWSSNQWGNPYGWNNYYGWNNGFYNRYRGTNVAYHTGRRSSTMSNRDRIGQASMIQSTKEEKVRKRRTINTNVTPIRNNTRVREVRSSEVRVIKPIRATTVIPPVRNNRNTTPIRDYNRTENNNRNSNNNIRNNNSRPIRTYSPPSRSSSPVISRPPTRSSTPISTKGRGNN